MGYFSRLACELACKEDKSYPPPETQLICRIMELKGRLAELSETGFISSDDRLSEQEIETVLPEHLSQARDLYRALEIAQRQLLRMVANNEEPQEPEMPHQLEFDINDTIDTNPLKRAA